MSFVYRHLVIPDLAPPSCKSNKFLFYGGTVTYRCRRAHAPGKGASRQNFASCSILARSAANCRLLRANSRAEISSVAPFLRRRATSAPHGGMDRKILQIVEGK